MCVNRFASVRTHRSGFDPAGSPSDSLSTPKLPRTVGRETPHRLELKAKAEVSAEACPRALAVGSYDRRAASSSTADKGWAMSSRDVRSATCRQLVSVDFFQDSGLWHRFLPKYEPTLLCRKPIPDRRSRTGTPSDSPFARGREKTVPPCEGGIQGCSTGFRQSRWIPIPSDCGSRAALGGFASVGRRDRILSRQPDLTQHRK
jgi:hypothetical protein